MFAESELLPLSGMQHLLYCERQWALIHLEQQWAESRHTAEGLVLHATADEAPSESRAGVRIVRALALHSFVYGLAGRADVVEFPLKGDGPPVPVEYKRGRPKPAAWDEVQLCAQALCLEEMLGRPVPEGAIYYGLRRRRIHVVLTKELRLLTADTAAHMHALYRSGRSPSPNYDSQKCDRCSLLELCQPKLLSVAKDTCHNWDRMLLASIRGAHVQK